MKPTGTVGYAAMFEQFHPTELLNWCKVAEESGFGSVMASDHFHPWTPDQGQSAFVWSWMGALGATTNLRFGTGVTPPGFRYHPAIIAPGSGDAGGDVPRTLLAWARRGRGVERAHRGGLLARGADQAAHTHGGHRGHPQALLGQGRQVQRRAHNAREREALHDAGYAAPDLRGHRRPHTEPQDGRVLRRHHHRRRRRREDKDADGEVRGGGTPRGQGPRPRCRAWYSFTSRGPRTRKRPSSRPSGSGPTAGCLSPRPTSAIPRTSRRWRSR